MFEKKEKIMFPLRRILMTIESLNSVHEPFLNTLQQLLNAVMGPTPKKNAPTLQLIKEEMQYWATYFFIDKLNMPFRQIFYTYREMYEHLANEEESTFVLFHISNCILVLIEWWLIKAQTHQRESFMTTYGKKLDQTAASIEIYSIRDEIEEMFEKIQVKTKFFMYIIILNMNCCYGV